MPWVDWQTCPSSSTAHTSICRPDPANTCSGPPTLASPANMCGVSAPVCTASPASTTGVTIRSTTTSVSPPTSCAAPSTIGRPDRKEAAMRSGPPRLLHSLGRDALAAAAADRRWPKWSSMCQLRLLGNPVLNGVCVPPNADATVLRTSIVALAEATGARKLMLRSDGGLETSAYYRGGNSFPTQLPPMTRLDRPGPEQPGTFTAEALGPGYDVGDLTRGGIRPQITVSIAGVTWHRYERPWWADMNVTRDLSSEAEHTRRQARLYRLIPHIRTVADVTSLNEQDQTSVAAAWLRAQGHLDLWRGVDATLRAVRSVPSWFDVAFLIAAAHPNRNWRCLATSLSDLGAGRVVYWDIVDAAHKFAAAALPERRIA